MSPEAPEQRSENRRCHISVVAPVYNEEANIRPFLARMVPVLERLGTYEILFALDPCSDSTEQIILDEAAANRNIGLLIFSRRFGQPAATMAGILNCRGDWCVIIDVDLQDPPELVAIMLRKAAEGFDVVTAKRKSRAGETWIKKLISTAGYRMLNLISEVEIPRDTGDFRIVNRRVIEELRRFKESHGFLRGLVALVGFRQAAVEYQRDVRYTGTGNYNRYLGSLKIAFNGLFGFSTLPLRLMMWTGLFIATMSALGILLILVWKLIEGKQYPLGIPTITVLILFIGGVQLAAVGILGEYIGRIYDEVRARPMYVIDRAFNVKVRDPHGPPTGPK
jgi:polyisoprenyl-phosphate glycosyltransferase